MSKKMKCIVAMILAMIMTSALFIGCSNSKSEDAPRDTNSEKVADTTGDSDDANTETNSKEVKTLKVAWSGGSTYLKEDNEKVHQYILDNTGIDLQVEYIPDDSYNEKMNLKFAGGEEIDAFRKIGLADSWVDLKDKGVIVPINKYVEKYPAIMEEFGDNFISAMDSDGQIWSMPRYNEEVMYIPAIREDWVHTLGMEMPTTLDEYEEYLEAVTTQDPNGNGQNDEIGLVPYWGMWGFWLGMRPAFLGVNGIDYINENEEVVSIYNNPNFKGLLETLNKWYENGWLYSEFETQSDDKKYELIKTNRVGSFVGWWFGGDEVLNSDIYYSPMQPWEDAPGGISGWGTSATYDPHISISSTSKNPGLYFEFLNWVMEEPENYLTCSFGLEGENWEWTDKENGVYRKLEGAEERYSYYYQVFSPFFLKFSNLTEEATTVLTKDKQRVKDEVAKYTQLPDTQNIWPFSYVGTEAEFITNDGQTLLDEAILKIIYGQQDIDTWDAVVEQYMELGGSTFQKIKTEQWRENFSSINPYANIK